MALIPTYVCMPSLVEAWKVAPIIIRLTLLWLSSMGNGLRLTISFQQGTTRTSAFSVIEKIWCQMLWNEMLTQPWCDGVGVAIGQTENCSNITKLQDRESIFLWMRNMNWCFIYILFTAITTNDIPFIVLTSAKIIVIRPIRFPCWISHSLLMSKIQVWLFGSNRLSTPTATTDHWWRLQTNKQTLIFFRSMILT